MNPLFRALAGAALAILAAGSTGAAAADSPGTTGLPFWNVQGRCAERTRNPLTGAVSLPIVNECIRREQWYYDLAKLEWPGASEQTRQYCIDLSRSRLSSYEVLEICVRQLGPGPAGPSSTPFRY